MLLFLITLLSISSVFSCDEYVSSCRQLNVTNRVYCMSVNISNYGSGDCFPVFADNITLDCVNNKIDGVHSNDAIDLGSSNNFTVKNCNITDWGVGVRGNMASDFTSLNNEMNDMAGYGIMLDNGNNPTVENTDIWGVTGVGGILFGFMNNPNITNCEIWDTPIGLNIGDGQGGIVERSIIRDNTDDGLYLYQSTTILINNCSVSGNTNAGIHLFANTNITYSVIQNNGIGIKFGAGSGCKIYNVFFNQTTNYQFSGLQSHNWNITKQLGTRVYSEGNYIGGNYYTNPTGTGYSDTCIDTDGDGFCDSIFNLNAYNYDELSYSDEFPVTTTTTTLTTTTTIPSWYCGDGNCDIGYGENQDNCCTDCGCPFYHKCVNNVCVETTSDMMSGMGAEFGNFFLQASIPLGGIALIGGVVIILIASMIGGIKDGGRK